jgi:hypothetical protein
MTKELPANAEPANPIREIDEIAFVINAKNLNPTMMTVDFLKCSGIVPNEWGLSKQPVLNANVSQISFQNGLNVIAQPRTVVFTEVIRDQKSPEIQSPEIAKLYIDKLPNADYQGLNISIKSVIPFPDSQDSARKYISQFLLSPGPWQDIGKAPMQAGLNLLYQLDNCQFNLNVNEAKLQFEQTSIGGILFSGSFNYSLENDNSSQQQEKLKTCIDNWNSDWLRFREIINERFLSRTESLFPSR